MKASLFALTMLVVFVPALAFSQTDPTTATQESKPAKQGNHKTITGCLTNIGKHDEYRLVDESGVTNLLYSNTVKLDSYVGQSVTVVGDQSAKPSTDTGTGRPAPHFKVLEIHSASGTCK